MASRFNDGTDLNITSHQISADGRTKNTTLIQMKDCKNVATSGNMVVNYYGGSKSGRVKRTKAHKPLTECQQKLSTEQKMEIREKLGADWKDFGRRLELTEVELNHLEHQFHHDHFERNYQLLVKWEEKYDDTANQANMAKVLVKLGRGDLADSLAESNEVTIEPMD